MTSSQLLAAMQALANAAKRARTRFMLIGGIAVIARGVARATADVDATIPGEGLDLEGFVEACAKCGVTPRIDDAVAFARQSQSLLLRHTASGIPIDVAVAWLPFELEAIERAEPAAFGPLTLPTALPEDLLVYKLVAARPRDLDDAEKLLLLHGDAMDLVRVRRIVTEFADALEDASKVENLERLLRRRSGAKASG